MAIRQRLEENTKPSGEISTTMIQKEKQHIKLRDSVSERINMVRNGKDYNLIIPSQGQETMTSKEHKI